MDNRVKPVHFSIIIYFAYLEGITTKQKISIASSKVWINWFDKEDKLRYDKLSPIRNNISPFIDTKMAIVSLHV